MKIIVHKKHFKAVFEVVNRLKIPHMPVRRLGPILRIIEFKNSSKMPFFVLSVPSEMIVKHETE